MVLKNAETLLGQRTRKYLRSIRQSVPTLWRSHVFFSLIYFYFLQIPFSHLPPSNPCPSEFAKRWICCERCRRRLEETEASGRSRGLCTRSSSPQGEATRWTTRYDVTFGGLVLRIVIIKTSWHMKLWRRKFHRRFNGGKISWFMELFSPRTWNFHKSVAVARRNKKFSVFESSSLPVSKGSLIIVLLLCTALYCTALFTVIYRM